MGYVKPARIQGGTPQDFDTFTLAYQAAGDGAQILLREFQFNESVNLNRFGIDIQVIGGYNPAYTTHSGVSVINGLTIGLGSAILENLTIK